jgi:hypothetical protein
MDETNNKGDLSPEEQRISSALHKFFADEKNIMSLRALCSSSNLGRLDGKETLNFIALGKGQGKLSDAEIQVKYGSSVANLLSWKDDVDGLAKELSAVVSPELVEVMLQDIEAGAQGFVERDGQWMMTDYGPNNDQTVTLDSLWEKQKK